MHTYLQRNPLALNPPSVISLTQNNCFIGYIVCAGNENPVMLARYCAQFYHASSTS